MLMGKAQTFCNFNIKDKNNFYEEKTVTRELGIKTISCSRYLTNLIF
jgi:hypothetical protein